MQEPPAAQRATCFFRLLMLQLGPMQEDPATKTSASMNELNLLVINWQRVWAPVTNGTRDNGMDSQAWDQDLGALVLQARPVGSKGVLQARDINPGSN